MSSDASGWSAIDAHLDTLYPDVTPQHFGTMIRYRLGGPDPLDGLSFYPRTEPVPHWHAVTYGFSELHDKESPDPEESGWGFELTFRIARDAGDTEAPMWAANLLQNLARYVFSSGNILRPGDHMDANGPLNVGHETTALTALAFLEDPELEAIATPNGTVRFVQVVGLTADELAAARAWDTAGLLGLLAERNPLLVTDLDRPSITADPAVRAALDAGRERDGSSTGQLMVVGLDVTAADTQVRLRIPQQHAAAVAQAARDRFPYARPLVLTNQSGRILMAGGPAYAVRHVDGGVEVELPLPAIDALSQPLAPGTHEIPGTERLTVEIVPE